MRKMAWRAELFTAALLVFCACNSSNPILQAPDGAADGVSGGSGGTGVGTGGSIGTGGAAGGGSGSGGQGSGGSLGTGGSGGRGSGGMAGARSGGTGGPGGLSGSGGGSGGIGGTTRNPSCTTSPVGCCFLDLDCAANQECVGAICGAAGIGVPFVAVSGVCKTRFLTGGIQCWQNSDCAHGCLFPRVCPCGAQCLLADAPGTCAAL